MKLLQNPHFFLTFDQVHNPLSLLHETTSERPKVPRTHQFSALLTWKCASRHNGVHFFNISTSKSGPKMVCFVLGNVLCATTVRTFSTSQLLKVVRTWCAVYGLGNVLRATTACTFSTSQLSKVVREWCVLHVLTWKCASRHNGVQLFISHLTTWLRPSEASNHCKNTEFRDFATLSRTCIFFPLTLSLL